MRLQKFCALLLALIFPVLVFASCGQKAAEIRVGALKGPSSLGMLQMMDKKPYMFTLAGAPAEIQAKLVSGELDIAAIPTNLAATLYNKTGNNVNVIAVSTLGVLYFLSRDSGISSFNDLAGKTVYATGQGASPEYVINHLLDANGLKDSATVEYKAEHAELAALMAAGEVDYAVLPQPFVTTATMKNPDVKIVADLNEEWRRAVGSELAMTCIVVRSEFLKMNKALVEQFIKDYRNSTEFVNSNVNEAAKLSGQYDIIPQAVAQAAIPKCAIVCITGDDMQRSIEPFLSVLFAANPQSVGGSLPDDAFYYKR